jgi:cytochrome P450
MNRSTLIKFPRRVLHYGLHLYYQSKAFLFNIKQEENLLFTFGGRNDGWPTIGRQLYQENNDFRETIQQCNRYLTEMGGAEILSYFEQLVNSKYFEDESKFTCITAIQLATVKKYNDNGYYPNAVMGVSMGEPAAAYAAGALTIKEALMVSLSYMTLYKGVGMDYPFIFLSLSYPAAVEFCNNSPVWTEIVFEDGPDAVLITCHKDNIRQLEEQFLLHSLPFKLVSQKTYVPYHSSIIKLQASMLKRFHQQIEPKPLKCDYYSTALGRMIPKNAFFGQDYWYKLSCDPVLFFSTLKSVVDDEYKILLQVGPPAISDRQFANAAPGQQIEVINTYQADTDELKHDQYIKDRLSALAFYKTSVTHDALTTLNEFKQNFNVASADSTAPFQYLRSYGPIHFLPVYHSWIVLNYDDIERVLREPEVFSSALLKEYDPILLGADPAQHKVIRSLLQPLFSPAVISELAQFTTVTATKLLDELCQQDNFDFVKDYSDRLSLLVLCNFFGLSSLDADRMLDYTGKDYHNMLYWQRLEEFFRDQFNVCELTKEDCLWAKLRDLVQKDQFTFDDAVSLLRIVWTAGMATTSALISTSVNITLNESAIADQISADEKLVSKFIEECLRLQTPLSAIYRITTQAVELCGQELPANTTVMLHLASGMSDPSQYANPSEFSVTRPAKRHLAFGTGIHQCIGMGIARAEARSALQVVITRLGNLEGYVHSEPQYITVSDLKTMSSLKVQRKNLS